MKYPSAHESGTAYFLYQCATLISVSHIQQKIQGQRNFCNALTLRLNLKILNEEYFSIPQRMKRRIVSGRLTALPCG